MAGGIAAIIEDRSIKCFMEVLIIDDSDEKVRRVEDAIKGGLPHTVFTRAKSFRSAIRELEKVAFDLVILDLVLPIRDDETPSDKGGEQVLGEILDGAGCQHPSHILCLTAFSGIALKFGGEAKKRLVHVVIFEESTD